MKKIVFVQKEEGSYDPISAFFGSKNKPASKITTTPSKLSASKVPPPKKNPPSKLASFEQNPTLPIKEDGPKSDFKQELPPVPKTNSKQQIRKNKQPAKTNLTKPVKNLPDFQSLKFIKKEEELLDEGREDSLQEVKKQEQPTKSVKSVTPADSQKREEQSKKIKQLQLREQEYLRRIQEYEAKEQKFAKSEQKLAKLQKDLKAAVQKSKEGEGALEKLREKDIQLKELVENKSIPFSRKREVILSNKLKELKRINRQLVLRLKSYKGTDLVELSIQQNREEVMKDLYTVDVEKQLSQETNIEMESLQAQLINKLQNYLSKRIKQKGERLEWPDEQTWLLDILNLSEKISLIYLDKYQICPLPQSNQEAVLAYSLLEQYKQSSSSMQKIIDKYHLNLHLSQQNTETMNCLQEGEQQIASIKAQLSKSYRKKQVAKNQMAQLLKIYEKRAQFSQILLIQDICHQQALKQWIEKAHCRVKQELTEISKVIEEIKNIVLVGETAKDSLYFYLSSNIPLLEARFPSLKLSLKEIKTSFSEIQCLSLSKSKNN